jgi:hypothetical protein
MSTHVIVLMAVGTGVPAQAMPCQGQLSRTEHILQYGCLALYLGPLLFMSGLTIGAWAEMGRDLSNIGAMRRFLLYMATVIAAVGATSWPSGLKAYTRHWAGKVVESVACQGDAARSSADSPIRLYVASKTVVSQVVSFIFEC